MRDKNEEYKNSLNKAIDKNSILNNLMKYCAYQERSVFDIHSRLDKYKVNEETRSEIVNKLTEEGFVNNRRFAVAYVSGKFRNNHWGKIKIRYGLQEKQISDQDIEIALNEIESDEYQNLLKKLMVQKRNQVKEKNIFILRNKIARFLIMRGFEPDLVWDVIREYIN